MGLFDFTEETHLAAAGKLPGTALTADGKVEKRKRIKVFQNDFLESYFGTAHPATPGIWLAPMVAGLYLGITGPQGWQLTLLLFLGGVVLVSLIEYFLHRVLFHLVPKNHSDQLSHFIMHGYHHDFPNDEKRLVLPLAFILPMASIVAAGCYAVLGADWLQLFAGACLGYIAYDWVHFYTHHFKPKNPIGKWLTQYHLLHHFDSPNHRYGISNPFWDLVFGTYLSNDVRKREMHKDRARKELPGASPPVARPSVSQRKEDVG